MRNWRPADVVTFERGLAHRRVGRALAFVLAALLIALSVWTAIDCARNPQPACDFPSPPPE